MANANDFMNSLLDDAPTRTAYMALAPAYEMHKAMLRARLRKNMSQEDVAARMRTTASAVSRLETPTVRTMPSMRSLLRYAEATDTELVIGFVPKNEAASAQLKLGPAEKADAPTYKRRPAKRDAR